MASSILPSFLGALQASLAVLLTISYGFIASRFNLLKESSARDISKLCVRLFLPALIITNIGSELHASTVRRYVPILIWALTYTLLSMGLGWVLKRAFKFPAWTIPAICFNNTTSLPLLLIQSLSTAGVLEDITMGEDDTISAALGRAKSYFLVCAMVGNTLTFAIGPKLLDDEESHEEPEDDRKTAEQQVGGNSHVESDEERANPTNLAGRTAEEEEEYINENTTLLPNVIAKQRDEVDGKITAYWQKLPTVVRTPLETIFGFVNAPILGAIIGCILGLTPPFHRVFFNDPEQGGIFKAWLTESVKNIGDLFAALQLVVVGTKLGTSLMKMKRGEASGNLALIPTFSIIFIRFILWPVISISLIYLLASRTSLLGNDPILWFVLMMLPTGPTATKLVSLADVSKASDEERMAVAKFLTVNYAVSPLICFAVVGSLKATSKLVG